MENSIKEKNTEPNLIVFARQTFTPLQKDIFTLAVSQLETGLNVQPDLPEPLEIAPEDFARDLRRRHTRVKALLLNQAFVRGAENIYADEALFHAGIHPLAKTARLRRDRAIRLHQALAEVLSEAVAAGGSFDLRLRGCRGAPGLFPGEPLNDIVGLARGRVRRTPSATGHWLSGSLVFLNSGPNLQRGTGGWTADRPTRMYLPLAAVIVIVMVAGNFLCQRLQTQLGWSERVGTKVQTGIVAGVAFALGFATVQRNAQYHSAESIWADVVASRPESCAVTPTLAWPYWKTDGRKSRFPSLSTRCASARTSCDRAVRSGERAGGDWRDESGDRSNYRRRSVGTRLRPCSCGSGRHSGGSG